MPGQLGTIMQLRDHGPQALALRDSLGSQPLVVLQSTVQGSEGSHAFGAAWNDGSSVKIEEFHDGLHVAILLGVPEEFFQEQACHRH